MTDRRIQHVHITIQGAVQGVGFRPFVFRLAHDLDLKGWVNNSSQGVLIEVEGPRDRLDTFILRLESDKPPLAHIDTLESAFSKVNGYQTFEIQASNGAGDKTTLVLPDMGICPDCLREILDPTNRRYQYPFTNCTNCGPRYTIIEALPYDRPFTTMKHFQMCDACQAEYENPLDRRFHAQPNACPECGPHLELWDKTGTVLDTHHTALLQTCEALRQGQIIAVKGLGGFHLLVDAQNESAVTRLRERKHREAKPFALMYPSLDYIRSHCEVSEPEARLLTSPEAPIVLLKRRSQVEDLAPSIAPDNPYLGVMLPYTPLHHLLLHELGFPVVATSGNLSDEPICIDEHEALERLSNIADGFLVHNRPIVRHVDDSITRVTLGQPQILRRARGYAPLPIRVKQTLPTIVSTGPHLKNTSAASVGQQVFISQHIGDLETVQAFDAFQHVLDSFADLYELNPVAIACDAHPDYLSTQYAVTRAERAGIPLIRVQHHYAHVLACMTEHGLDAPVLGVSWDGTGYGSDGTIWGGEFLAVDGVSFTRTAHLKTFRLPGGDKAVKEPRRSAIGLLYEVFGDALFEMAELAPVRAFSTQESRVVKTMLNKQLNAPQTSSAGRLFDAVASLVDLRQQVKFEGQAAMEAEFSLDGIEADACYPFDSQDTVLDWSQMVYGILNDMERGFPVSEILAKFHNTLVEMIVTVARRANMEQIVLTGGCFQNMYLTEHTVKKLTDAGFRPYWHQRVPPNDGGVALGQIMAALRELKKG